MLESLEMRIIRRVTNKTLRDRERSEDVRRICNIENINQGIKVRKVKWYQRIGRLINNRVVRVATDILPNGTRPRRPWSDDL